jgi:hypothetical protein
LNKEVCGRLAIRPSLGLRREGWLGAWLRENQAFRPISAPRAPTGQKSRKPPTVQTMTVRNSECRLGARGSAHAALRRPHKKPPINMKKKIQPAFAFPPDETSWPTTMPLRNGMSGVPQRSLDARRRLCSTCLASTSARLRASSARRSARTRSSAASRSARTRGSSTRAPSTTRDAATSLAGSECWRFEFCAFILERRRRRKEECSGRSRKIDGEVAPRSRADQVQKGLRAAGQTPPWLLASAIARSGRPSERVLLQLAPRRRRSLLESSRKHTTPKEKPDARAWARTKGAG